MLVLFSSNLLEKELKVCKLLRLEGLNDDLRPFCGLCSPSAILCSAIHSNNIIDGSDVVKQSRISHSSGTIS